MIISYHYHNRESGGIFSILAFSIGNIPNKQLPPDSNRENLRCVFLCLSLLCVRVAVPRSQLVSRSALCTTVVKRHKPQELATPVCGNARSALCLLWLRLDSRIGHRPIQLFAGEFPSFFDNPDTDRVLDLDGFFVLGPPGFFAECVMSHSKRIPQNPFGWSKFS